MRVDVMTNKRICESDLKEIELFRQWMDDQKNLTPREFVDKYREYMGLSENEAESYIRQQELKNSIKNSRIYDGI